MSNNVQARGESAEYTGDDESFARQRRLADDYPRKWGARRRAAATCISLPARSCNVERLLRRASLPGRERPVRRAHRQLGRRGRGPSPRWQRPPPECGGPLRLGARRARRPGRVDRARAARATGDEPARGRQSLRHHASRVRPVDRRLADHVDQPGDGRRESPHRTPGRGTDYPPGCRPGGSADSVGLCRGPQGLLSLARRAIGGRRRELDLRYGVLRTSKVRQRLG